jgi:GNAT superfamily N-acetyltransferase
VTRFVVERAAGQHAPALNELFRRAECACHCRYWHFQGDKNAWLDRLANAPEQNRAEFVGDLAAESPAALGMLALTADPATERNANPAPVAVGWMKLAPAETLSSLYAQRLYRNLPCFQGDRTGVFAVGCFLVDPEWRRRGVARALVEHGIGVARTLGARSIEAFPRRAEGVSDGELWQGHPEIFFALGFREVHEFAPYPVLRLELAPT